MFQPHLGLHTQLKVGPRLVTEATVALPHCVQHRTLYSKLAHSFLALIIRAEASCWGAGLLLCCLVSSPPPSQSCPRYFFCASHYFKYLYTLSCMSFATALMAKLTLNYSHCTDEESEAQKGQLVPGHTNQEVAESGFEPDIWLQSAHLFPMLCKRWKLRDIDTLFSIQEPSTLL